MHIVSGVFIEGETYVMRLQAVIVGVLLISLSRNGKDFSTKKRRPECTAPQKLDMKNLTFGVFFYEINL